MENGEVYFKRKEIRICYSDCQNVTVDTKGAKRICFEKKLLRSGTTIGALISEAEFGQSKADFIHKLTIFLKEANETNYLLNLLHDTDCVENESFVKLSASSTELTKMLIASINTSKLNRS